MNSKEIFEKIIQKNKEVINCGIARSNTYLGYVKASLEYDSSKRGFYTAMELASLEKTVPEDRKPKKI